jgi:hypothetical protein
MTSTNRKKQALFFEVSHETPSPDVSNAVTLSQTSRRAFSEIASSVVEVVDAPVSAQNHCIVSLWLAFPPKNLK